MPMGRDIGFIPGDVEEKMRPWMQPIYDAVEMIREQDRRSSKRTQEQSWKLVEDPIITRGGCEIISEPSAINATLENRLSALAASVLGDERERD